MWTTSTVRGHRKHYVDWQKDEEQDLVTHDGVPRVYRAVNSVWKEKEADTADDTVVTDLSLKKLTLKGGKTITLVLADRRLRGFPESASETRFALR